MSNAGKLEELRCCLYPPILTHGPCRRDDALQYSETSGTRSTAKDSTPCDLMRAVVPILPRRGDRRWARLTGVSVESGARIDIAAQPLTASNTLGSTGCMRRSVTRRQAVRLIAGGAAGLVISGRLLAGSVATAREPATDSDGLAGVVHFADSSGLMIRETGGRLVSVTPEPDARLYSGPFGIVDDPAAFIPGDYVAASGRF